MSEFDDYCDYCLCLSQSELNEAFIDAMNENDFDKVKFLLSSSDLKEHADVHTNQDEAFRILCIGRNIDILNYLILHLNIEQTKKINEHLNWYKKLYKDAKSIDCVEFIEKAEYMFQQRELKKEISLELKENLNFGKKYKL